MSHFLIARCIRTKRDGLRVIAGAGMNAALTGVKFQCARPTCSVDLRW